MASRVSDKTRAVLVGVFILVAYGVLAGQITQQKVIVMFADVISGLAVIGIAVLLFPLFKPFNKNMSAIYLALKYVEGILMVIGGLVYLSPSNQELRNFIYEDIHVYVFIISAFILYYMLYTSVLVPRFISIWGALGIFALLISTLLKLMGVEYPAIDYFLILIITNEVFLAIWLMVKGFNEAATND